MVINPIVGVYIPIIRIPIKGGMTISNIATFDHGTFHGCNVTAPIWPNYNISPTADCSETPLGNLDLPEIAGVPFPFQQATEIGGPKLV